MNYKILVGYDFRDHAGDLVRNFSLCPAGSKNSHAVGIIDTTNGVADRIMIASSVSSADRNAFLNLVPYLNDPSTTKILDWAYPSSDRAKEHGFGDTGCWVILLDHNRALAAKQKPAQPPVAIRAFGPGENQSAIAASRAYNWPWDPAVKKIHPEYIADPAPPIAP